MVESADRVVLGARILQRILGVARVAIAVEENKPDAIAALSEAAKPYADISVHRLHVKYPQGAEKQLIYALTGRRVPPPPALPLDVGAVVQNVATAAAVAAAITEGEPLVERIVTVSGEGAARPTNLLAPVGTLLRDLVEYCGGFAGEPGKLVAGGPMMGVAQHTLDVPMTKGTSGVLLFDREAATRAQPNRCLRCGACIDGCPMNLMPTELASAVLGDDLEGAEQLGIDVCVECGSCAYLCPSHNHLVHVIRLGKSQLHARRRAKT
jgi:electron transport complex protein RnfC